MAGSISKEALLRITGNSADADEKLAAVSKRADELREKHPDIAIRVNTAEAQAKLAILKAELKDLGAGGAGGGAFEEAGASATAFGADLGKLSNFAMPALIGSLVATAPILFTAGSGLGLFAAAAFKTLQPIEQAAQQTGGLANNLGRLAPLQLNVAEGLLSLESNFKTFSRSVQPQILTAVTHGLGIAGSVLKGLTPVAQAAGTALDTVLGRIDAEFQSGEWKSFFDWMAKNAGPDVEELGSLIVDLTRDLPPLLENLQPVANALVLTADGTAKLIYYLNLAQGPILRTSGLLEQWTHLSTNMHDTTDNLTNAVLNGTRGMVGLWNALKNYTTGSDAAKTKTDGMASSLGTEAQHAQSVSTQITNIDNALAKLLDPTSSSIDAAITFANDQAQLAAALKTSSGQLGLQTQASRDAASAMTQAVGGAEALSNSILQQTHSTQQAAIPLQAMLTQLENLHSTSPLVTKEIQALEAAIKSLTSKQITITVAGQIIGSDQAINIASGLAKTGGNSSVTQAVIALSGRAAGGPASGWTLVGERGPELVNLPSGSMVYDNARTNSMLNAAASPAGAYGGVIQVRLSLAGADGPIAQAVMAGIRAEVQSRGGGAPDSVQRTFGRVA